ncbi:MAG: penicillin-binding protein 1C [Candidatus Azobacteroides sp.]|nr:penicillin-binding protein 1C [Candidatus Azobacteroides sp.]
MKTSFFPTNLYLLFTRLSSRKKIGLLLVFLLLLFYILCLPSTLFTVPYATVVTDREGELLGARIASDGQWRFPPSGKVPDKFAQCLVLFEDRYFHSHWGVNPVSIGRAMVQNVKSKRVVSGGSTITMQTIRLSRGNQRTPVEKLIEMILATQLEFRYSKKEIINLYASHAPFGGNVVGLEAASWRYFGHSSDELSWAEAALMAVLPNAPSMIHLSRNRNALLNKRNRLLKKLSEEGIIDASTYELAISEGLPEAPQPLPQIAPHLVSGLHLSRTGEKTTSSINKEVQVRVEEVLERWNNEFSRSDIRNLAAIVIDVQKNEVIAYCGNVRFGESMSGNQVDVLRAPRSSGSILKPLLYCAMLQEGELLPDMLLPDIPVNINGFSPQNFNRQFDGAVPASEALARSLNIPSVYMLKEYSVPKFYHFLKEAGISTLTYPASHYGLSLILGGAETTLWDVSSGYCQMARILQGMETYEPVLTLSGELPAPVKTPFSAGAVWQTFEAIKEVNRPEEIAWRTIPSMQRIAWKTGTSYGFRDGWAVGVTAGYVVGVWAGNANGEGKPGLTGARTAGPVMFDIFNLLPATPWFSPPYEEMTEGEICRASGHLKGRFCMEYDTLLIVPNGLRTRTCSYHIQVNVSEDERCRVYEECAGEDGMKQKSYFVLPPAWEWYYKQHHPEYVLLPPFKSSCPGGNDSPMQFIYPQGNTTIYLPKQLDGSPGEVIFELAHTQPDAEIYWHVDEEYITSTRYFHRLSLHPATGKHSVTVIDNSGNSLSVAIEIK